MEKKYFTLCNINKKALKTILIDFQDFFKICPNPRLRPPVLNERHLPRLKTISF